MAQSSEDIKFLRISHEDFESLSRFLLVKDNEGVYVAQQYLPKNSFAVTIQDKILHAESYIELQKPVYDDTLGFLFETIRGLSSNPKTKYEFSEACEHANTIGKSSYVFIDTLIASYFPPQEQDRGAALENLIGKPEGYENIERAFNLACDTINHTDSITHHIAHDTVKEIYLMLYNMRILGTLDANKLKDFFEYLKEKLPQKEVNSIEEGAIETLGVICVEQGNKYRQLIDSESRVIESANTFLKDRQMAQEMQLDQDTKEAIALSIQEMENQQATQKSDSDVPSSDSESDRESTYPERQVKSLRRKLDNLAVDTFVSAAETGAGAYDKISSTAKRGQEEASNVLSKVRRGAANLAKSTSNCLDKLGTKLGGAIGQEIDQSEAGGYPSINPPPYNPGYQSLPQPQCDNHLPYDGPPPPYSSNDYVPR